MELQNSFKRKRQEQQVPPPKPHLWGLANKKGEEWGLALPTLAKSPDSKEGGWLPSLGPAGNVGGPRGEKFFPLPHSFCCQDP